MLRGQVWDIAECGSDAEGFVQITPDFSFGGLGFFGRQEPSLLDSLSSTLAIGRINQVSWS